MKDYREQCTALLRMHGERLADDHIGRYRQSLMDARRTHSSHLEQFQALLALWRSIRRKEYVFDKLTPDEQFEVMDVLEKEKLLEDKEDVKEMPR